MNFKTNKDIIIRVVKNFIGVIAVGAMVLLITLMLFAESLIISKEVMALLIGTAILCLGVGGLVSAIHIFFFCCINKITKLEKAIAERDRIISSQNNQLEKVGIFAKSNDTSANSTHKTVNNTTGKKIFKEIAPLSDEDSNDESSNQDADVDSEGELNLPEDSPSNEDI